ncbi:RepB family plasmid replication initiator protein [Cetobacterium somerae]|uniref:replication initiation protein n=1 Tax=Cetobacterium sp. NK01 TaxID=2993530 RepID=UPI002116EABF|nr:RepB family plasmid replication initiator protein [Cetobacterium sp. NK01]MCQ8213643.1 RepB family plasmid replication initiator protein [Cetobacterium sp. NK01]
MDLIKYHNDINKLKLGNFTTKELDVFFSLLLKSRDEKTKDIIISYSEIKELIQEEQNQARLTNYIRGVSRKLKELNQEIELPNGDIVIFGLFDVITIKPKDKSIVFSVNEIFKYMIDDLVKIFTMFDLRELVSLKGIYPKTLFRLLKQWESTGEYIVKINEFREIMGIPNTYLMKNIRQKIFKPCLEELGKNFERLELKELKKGRNVETLVFTWKAKKKKQVEQNSVIKKKQFLGEKDLKEYQDQSQERKENKLVNQVEKIDKIKISKADYEELYKKYLEENRETHNPFIKKGFDIANKSKYEIVEFEQPKLEQTKIYTVEDIPKEKLLDKNGNKLRGMLLNNRVNKILKEMNATV